MNSSIKSADELELMPLSKTFRPKEKSLVLDLDVNITREQAESVLAIVDKVLLEMQHQWPTGNKQPVKMHLKMVFEES